MPQSFHLREQAERCRRLARSASDSITRERLEKPADEYDAQANAGQDASEQALAMRRAKPDEEG
jgi:hypothetical protein